jgi:hypothetical protein
MELSRRPLDVHEGAVKVDSVGRPRHAGAEVDRGVPAAASVCECVATPAETPASTFHPVEPFQQCRSRLNRRFSAGIARLQCPNGGYDIVEAAVAALERKRQRCPQSIAATLSPGFRRGYRILRSRRSRYVWKS